MATKFELWCEHSECYSKTDFYTTETTGKVFNKPKMVVEFGLIGNVLTATRKVLSLLGLANPINTASCDNHTLNLEKIAFQMMTECMIQAVELTKKKKKKKIKTTPQDTDDNTVDIATSFDGF